MTAPPDSSFRHTLRTGGFTLVEMITAIVLVGLLATIGAEMLGVGFTAYFTGRDLTEADAQGRTAMERLTRELRLIRARGDLAGLTPASISFTDSAGNAIAYALAGTDLTRNGQVLAEGVSAFNLSYFDSALAVATPATVYYVTVDLNITHRGTNQNYRATVHPRGFQ